MRRRVRGLLNGSYPEVVRNANRIRVRHQDEKPTHSAKHLVLDYHDAISGRTLVKHIEATAGHEVDIAWRVHLPAAATLRRPDLPPEAKRQRISPGAGALTAEWKARVPEGPEPERVAQRRRMHAEEGHIRP